MSREAGPRAIGERDCTCPWTPPETWFRHYGAVEPGSTREYDPWCPEHGDAAPWRVRRDNLAAGLNDAPTGLTGWNLPDEERPRLVMTRSGIMFVPGRWVRLDALWFAVGVNRAGRQVAEAVNGVMRALSGADVRRALGLPPAPTGDKGGD